VSFGTMVGGKTNGEEEVSVRVPSVLIVMM
jgi:hypothetical protein